MELLKNKRVILIALATVFVVSLFFFKTSTVFKKEGTESTELSVGNLSYEKTILKDLIKRDTDGDGVTDWEEELWGTNPYVKDTDGDGITDKEEIAALEKAARQNLAPEAETASSQTDLFARELLTVVTTLNQTGELDPVTLERLGETLVTEIEKSSIGKIYALSEIKIIKDNSVQAAQKYDLEMQSLIDRHPIKINVLDVFSEFLAEEEAGLEPEALTKLDSVVQTITEIVKGMASINVPQEFSALHLKTLNALQRLADDLTNIRLLESDPLLALNSISQYEGNVNVFERVATELVSSVNKKIRN